MTTKRVSISFYQLLV